MAIVLLSINVIFSINIVKSSIYLKLRESNITKQIVMKSYREEQVKYERH